MCYVEEEKFLEIFLIVKMVTERMVDVRQFEKFDFLNTLFCGTVE